MSVDDRWKEVISKKLCINCLRKFHMANKCRFTNTCKACHRKHHTSLHRFYSNSEEPNVSNTVCYSNSNLDNANSENVPTVRENIQLSTTCLNSNSVDSNTLLSTTLLKVKNVEVVTKVTSDLPNFKFDSSYWPHLQGLKLADPTFFIASPIDILLGADMYAEMLLGQLISGKKGTPVAINSHLGWLVSGRIFSDAKHEKDVVNCHLVATLESQLKAFWELESIPQTEVRTKDDTVCERFYDSTVTRSSGRYTVRLPFNNFGNSASQALKRFNYLEAKLSKNNSLREQYSKFMLEYLQLGHMELVPPDEIDKEKSFYLPHHFVINEDSSTTKLRVVFDASAKDSNGNSLNSALFLGPRLQPELFSILLKFRYFKIAISGDIEKMYRQIRMNNEDSDFQRMFWRFNPDDDLQVYRLLTVTYGTACAPFLAVRTLKQLANDEEVSFPEASKVLQDEFYIDDLLSGADSIAEAKQLATDLNALLERGGFNLRKWASNCSEVFNNIPDHALACRDILIKETHQLMADLPRDRVIPSKPFQRVGMDFAGPISTKPNLPRSKVTLKSYIALFICFATKAVHLELVSDLSTEAFLASFRRFIARRGLLSDVYSDNATNFKEASNYLKSLYKIVRDNSVQDFSSNLQIFWHFIPPATPHFGGLWESNI
nr:uncharacterized protein LOC122269463 [Parasteatoda tepidariorum]